MQGGTAQNKKRFIIVSLILILSLALPCFATVTESSGDGFALYNGLKLPNIDSVWTDKVSYPYVGIVGTADAASAVFSSLPLSVISGTTIIGDSAIGVGTTQSTNIKLCLLHDGEWASAGETTVNAGVVVVTPQPNDSGWASYDIHNSLNNSTYLSASDPVSLDGYHVIEWDGDRTGLLTETVPFLGSNLYFSVVSDPLPFPDSSSYFVSQTSQGSQYGFLLDPALSEVLSQDGSNWNLFPLLGSVFSPPYSFEASGVIPVTLSYPGFYFGSAQSSTVYHQLYAYRESETEGPTGAVTGLTITNPPLGVDTDFTAYAGSDLQCTAEVTGTGDYNTGITWSVQYDPQYNLDVYPTISESGLLHLPSTMQAQTIIVVATSVQDPSIGDFVPVNILPPAVSSVTITPSSATAAPGENIQFSATVSGSNVQDPDVTWSVGAATSPSTRITRDGLLLIGSDEASPLLGVRATSNQDGSVYSTVLVTVSVPAAVTGLTISPDDITLNRGDIQQFTATVTGTGSYDNSVTWQITSVYSAGTSISNTGLLTIGEEQKYDYIIIKATSTADPSFSATAYVFVEDALSDPMNIDLSVVERLLEEIKNYLKTLQHILDRPHYFREFNMYTGKLSETEEQITGLTFNFYRFMQNMEEYVGSIAYTFANGAEVQIREDTTEGFDWFSLFFGKNSSSKVEETDFAGVSTLVNHTRDLFDTGFGFSDFFDLLDTVPFFTSEVGSSLDTTVHTYDFRDPDPFNMSILNDREKLLEEWRNKNSD